MACSVLRAARLWAAAWVLVIAPSAGFGSGAERHGCSQKGSAGNGPIPESAIREIEAHSKDGPLYRELLLQFGRPLSCKLTVEGGVIELKYAFRNGVQLMVRSDRTIETNEQQVRIPHMPMNKAIALLQAAEKASYPPTGCQIAWDHPDDNASAKTAGTREVVYRGGTCNCQARIARRGDYAVLLVLTSAC